MDELCANCRKVAVDKEDNTITFVKRGRVVRGRVCQRCFFNLEEVPEKRGQIRTK